jgi:hypothetical protein
MAASNSPWWKKTLWLIAIWAMSVAAMGIAAYVMRLLMRAADLVPG